MVNDNRVGYDDER